MRGGNCVWLSRVGRRVPRRLRPAGRQAQKLVTGAVRCDAAALDPTDSLMKIMFSNTADADEELISCTDCRIDRSSCAPTP